MAEFPAPKEGILLTHFIVSDDVERSRRFYTDVLGGETVRAGEPSFVALANSWIIINAGGGPTEDKPTVMLETPPDPDRISSFLNIRVADIQAVYDEWSERGAEFLTAPQDRGAEIRCYIRDPDGHLIEVGQTSQDFLEQIDRSASSAVEPEALGQPARLAGPLGPIALAPRDLLGDPRRDEAEQRRPLRDGRIDHGIPIPWRRCDA